MTGTPKDEDPDSIRRVITERQGWPEGVFEECVKVEADFPLWYVYWGRGGFCARTLRKHRRQPGFYNRYHEAFGATVDELREALTAINDKLMLVD